MEIKTQDILERIKNLVENLKEVFGERIIFSKYEIEENVCIEAELDEKAFTILFVDNEYVRVFIPKDFFEDLEKLLTPVIKKSLKRYEHFAYNSGKKTRVLEWDMKKTFEKRRKQILNEGPTDGVTFYWGNSGTIKSSPSILAFRHELIFKPLPKEQRLTEKTLLDLERRIAKSVRIHEQAEIMSEYYAAHPFEAARKRENEELREQVKKLSNEVEELKGNKEEKEEEKGNAKKK